MKPYTTACVRMAVAVRMCVLLIQNSADNGRAVTESKLRSATDNRYHCKHTFTTIFHVRHGERLNVPRAITSEIRNAVQNQQRTCVRVSQSHKLMRARTYTYPHVIFTLILFYITLIYAAANENCIYQLFFL